MVNNISSKAIGHTSVGEYNTVTKVVKLWVYFTRFRLVDGERYIDLQDSDLSAYLSNAVRVDLVDLDWDKVYPMSVKEYLSTKAAYGKRIFKVSDLKCIN